MDLSCFNWVQIIKKSDLPPNAKYLAYYLSTFMNYEHDIAWPSQSRISCETGLSEPTVRKWLQHLNKEGYLITKKAIHIVKTGQQNYYHNEYLIDIPQGVINLLSANSRGKTGDEQGVNESLAGGKQLTPNNNRINNKNNNKENSDSAPQKSHCPYQDIISLYHKKLPSLPHFEKLTEKRKTQMRKLWVDDLGDLEYWGHFFDHVDKSDFLMGRTVPVNGHRHFRANLEWITNPANYVKIYEDFYHE